MKHSVPLKEIANRMAKAAGDGPHRTHHKAVSASVNLLAGAVEGLETLAGSRSPLETKEAHVVRLAAAAKKLEGRANSAESRIAETVQYATQSISDAIDKKAGLEENRYAPEIRAAVRRLPARERDVTLRDAVAAGDAPTVAALTSGPAVLSGLTPDYRDKMREQFRQTHAKDEYEALNALHDLWSSSATAVGVARDAAKAAVNPGYLAQIEKDQAAAAKAQADFDSLG